MDSSQTSPSFRTASWCYILATVVWVVGIQCAAAYFPGSFRWGYTVISALASRKHNPEGAAWFAGAMLAAMLLLWPVVIHLLRAGSPLRNTQKPLGDSSGSEPAKTFAYYAKEGSGGLMSAPPRWVSVALRMGVACGMFVGLERLVFYHFSSLVRKGHEIVALLSFLSFYAGVLGLYAHRVRTRRAFLLPAALVVVPLVGVGVREFVLYLSQRGVGWADYDWHGAGTPLWLSFAWWQWLAAVLLWLSFGHLLLTATRKTENGEQRTDVRSENTK